MGRYKTYSETERRVRRILCNITARCTNPRINKYYRYGGRGIECFLTMEDLLILWKRDFADSLRHPSIDRRNENANYTFENCRFIEFEENRKRTRRKRYACTQCGAARDSRNKRCLKCRTTFKCSICHQISPGKRYERYCQECRFTTQPCGFCSVPVTRDRGRNYRGYHSKIWFCKKEHQGSWLGALRTRRLASKKNKKDFL